MENTKNNTTGDFPFENALSFSRFSSCDQSEIKSQTYNASPREQHEAHAQWDDMRRCTAGRPRAKTHHTPACTARQKSSLTIVTHEFGNTSDISV